MGKPRISFNLTDAESDEEEYRRYLNNIGNSGEKINSIGEERHVYD